MSRVVFVRDKGRNEALNGAYNESAFLQRENERISAGIETLRLEGQAAERRRGDARSVVKGLGVMVQETIERDGRKIPIMKVPDNVYKACFSVEAWKTTGLTQEARAAVAELRRANADVSRINSTRTDREATLRMMPREPARIAARALSVLGLADESPEKGEALDALMAILECPYLKRGPKGKRERPVAAVVAEEVHVQPEVAPEPVGAPAPEAA